jgi:hypothetical protein
MRTIRLLSALFLCLCSFDSIGQKDFRNVNWGMTIEEVKGLETAPLTVEEKNIVGYKDGKEYYDGNNLIYNGASVAGKSCNLIYYFKNGLLRRVRVIFVPDLYNKYDKEISSTILSFGELYRAMSLKGFRYTSPFRCGDHIYDGPDRQNPDNEKIFAMQDWNVNEEMLNLISKMVNEKRYKAVFCKMENERTRGGLQFLTKHSEWQPNTPVILELIPSIVIEDSLRESSF